jgi:hypothetical protein
MFSPERKAKIISPSNKNYSTAPSQLGEISFNE